MQGRHPAWPALEAERPPSVERKEWEGLFTYVVYKGALLLGAHAGWSQPGVRLPRARSVCGGTLSACSGASAVCSPNGRSGFM